VLGSLAASVSGAATPMSVPKTLTGTYQLYCPDPVETPIVLHVRTRAVISPVKPAQGRHFQVAGFQTEVTFPQGLASALSQMSPITGGGVLRRDHPGISSGRGVQLLGARPRRQPRRIHRDRKGLSR